MAWDDTHNADLWPGWPAALATVCLLALLVAAILLAAA